MPDYQKYTDRAPEYKSHKVIKALEIKSVDLDEDKAELWLNKVGPEDFISYDVPFQWHLTGGAPKAGDYVVFYQNPATKVWDYSSWSPKAVFEDGYTILPRMY